MGQGSNLVEPETALGVKAKNQKPTPSEGQKQDIRYQRKRRERHWRFLCHCISLWSTCFSSPMAGTRDGNFQFTSIPNCHYVDSISAGCCGYGRGSQGSLPRRGYATPECERHDRESRKGCSQGCCQGPSLCNQGTQPSAEDAGRKSRCQAAASSPMGQACQRGYSDLARSVTKLPQATNGLSRDHQQGQARHRVSQEHYSAFECQGCQHGSDSDSACRHEVGGRGGHRCRHRRRS